MRIISVNLIALCLLSSFAVSDAARSQTPSPCPKAKGAWWHNCVGARTYRDGETYTGLFRNNKANGVGQSVYPGGPLYRGMHVDDKRTGPGAAIYSQNDVYRGDFLENFRHGKGVYVSDTETYHGEFWKGKATGHAVQIMSDGQKYVGMFKNDIRHGLGTLYGTDGRIVHSGLWRDGKFALTTPTPRYERLPDGSIADHDAPSEGHLFRLSSLPHCPHGGQKAWTDCNAYSLMNDGEYFGEVKNNRPSGEGVLFKDTGLVYFGSLREGIADGPGVLRSPKGVILEGRFAKGNLTGAGRQTWPDGLVYVGDFKSANPHGSGRISLEDGSFLEGVWADGLFVKPKLQGSEDDTMSGDPAIGAGAGLIFRDQKATLRGAGVTIAYSDKITFGDMPSLGDASGYTYTTIATPKSWGYVLHHQNERVLSVAARPPGGQIIDLTSNAKGARGPSGWSIGDEVGPSRPAAPCHRPTPGKFWCPDPEDKTVLYQVMPAESCKPIVLDERSYWIPCGAIVGIAAIPDLVDGGSPQ